MIIPENHLIYRSTDIMQQICQPLFDMLPISHFEYDRLYFDGGMITLMNSEPELLKYYYELELFPNLDEIRRSVEHPTFVSKSTLEQIIVDDDGRWHENIQLAEQYQVKNRFFIVRQQPKYCETFGFVIKMSDLEAMNFCMRNLAVLNNFVDYFKVKAKGLLAKIEKNKINTLKSQHPILDLSDEPPILRKVEAFKEFLKNEPILMGGKALTDREKQCLELISKGYTMKMCAQKLELSPRTVESYLRNLKTKLNVNTIGQLVEFWHS